MASGSTASAASSSSSSSSRELIAIFDMPFSRRQALCNHLDELNAWPQMAETMQIRPDDVQRIRRLAMQGNSASEELLKIWGDQYNHNVTELFMVLKGLKLYQAMRIIKELVGRKYHLYIPQSQPLLTELMASAEGGRKGASDGEPAAQSKKLLNYGASPYNNNNNNNHNSAGSIDTSDNNYTSSQSSSYSSDPSNSNNNNINGVGRKNEPQAKQPQSNMMHPNRVKDLASSIPEISYEELTDATNNWSDQMILGKGGFGTVYRGYWRHSDFAIKQIHYHGMDGRENAKVQLQQSLNELKYLNSCRHDNILALYGYSINGEKPCIVYQLMKGGSLEQRLHSKKLPPLTWQQRIGISKGTACGIHYLHTFRVIHGDIKPANVLLDQCLEPRIGDFGLAREGPNAINSAVEVSQVFGTKPYLPPEFLSLKKLSVQIDTYSFGVVLLETFTGLRAYDKNRAHPLLTRHVLKFAGMPEAQLNGLIDRAVPLQAGEEEMCRRCIELGLRCIADNPAVRPNMEAVLTALHEYSRHVYPAND